MDNKKLLKICDTVALDVEKDIVDFDGKTFDGKTVATLFGYQAAAIKALSDVLREVIKKINTLENDLK